MRGDGPGGRLERRTRRLSVHSPVFCMDKVEPVYGSPS